ncbi:Cytochrome P450 CYP6, partial [Frankliniella occidentalis]
FYVDMLRESAAFRARTRTRRTDFVDLMLSAAAPSRAQRGLSEQHDFLTAKDRRRHCALAYDVVAAQAFVLPAHAPRVVARCLRELAGLPDLQQRVAQEVRSARDPDQPLGLQVLRRAPLLEKVLLEALRLEPPCSALSTEVGAGGYALPVVGPRRGLLLEPGTHLYVAVDAVHRDADLYPDPLRFDPERFSAAARRARPTGAYLPFGELPGPDGVAEWAASGLPPPASSTAALFALQEMGLCLAALLADLEFGV